VLQAQPQVLLLSLRQRTLAWNEPDWLTREGSK